MTTCNTPALSRTEAIRRRFGIKHRSTHLWPAPADGVGAQVLDLLRGGEVILVEGASGSGKSTLLRFLADRLKQRVIESEDLHIPDRAVIDCLDQLDLEQALELLARFGLGEVYAYLSPARQLSTGQQSRLRLAMAAMHLMRRAGGVMICDEFATRLDRYTAAIIARAMGRFIQSQAEHSAIVATCCDGLDRALRPAWIVRCDFGSTAIVRG